MTAAVPLLQWGSAPGAKARHLWAIGLAISVAAVCVAWATARWAPLALAVVGLAVFAATSLSAAWIYDGWRRNTRPRWHGLVSAICNGRRKYAAYSIHLGFVCVAVGVAASSLGTQRKEVTLDEGAVIDWAGRRIRYVRLEQHDFPDKLVATAVLEIQRGKAAPIELRPARHLHLLQNEWTTEVAIHSTWRGDFYTILNAGLGEGRVALTLVDNPMIRWIWAGGALTTFSAIVAIWPARSRDQTATDIAHESPTETSANEAQQARASAA
jgi:cytochrome c-type biogenesis protein CcmF